MEPYCKKDIYLLFTAKVNKCLFLVVETHSVLRYDKGKRSER